MKDIIKNGITSNIISLVLCICIVTSCMYVYSEDYIIPLTLVTIIIQSSVFIFYNYISKKSLLLRFVSVLGSFAAICCMAVIAVKTGNNQNSLDYFIWFLSPQALVEFSASYIAATFIIINFFIASTVYYFSAVRYRISMTFLITLIPFAVYRKESEAVPVIFAILLLVMYVALMIHCRNMNVKPENKLIIDKGYKKSMTYFLLSAAFVAFVVPKPNININNDWIDSILEFDAVTKYMMSRLGIVSDSSTSSSIYTGSSNIELFEFTADEYPINLKSQTYSIYDYENNTWYADDSDKKGLEFVSAADPSDFYRAVAAASSTDKAYSEKYDFGQLKSDLPEQYKRSFSLVNSYLFTKYYFSVPNVYDVSGQTKSNILKAENGMLVSNGNSGKKYKVSYYSDTSVLQPGFTHIVQSLNGENNMEFLEETYNVLAEAHFDSDAAIITEYMYQYEKAHDYLDEFNDELPEKITELVEEITKDCFSDYEKAIAIQDYFLGAGYLYDLKYQKPDNYNMEYFLLQGKTGICTDYATAMVLMARCAGIPARYAEGVHLDNPDPQTGVITVSDSDLHAFPELYISGYGWMSFEPTKIREAEDKTGYSYLTSVILISSTILLIIFIIVFSKVIVPELSEKLFRRKISHSSNEKAVELTVNRMRLITSGKADITSGELVKDIYEKYGLSYYDIAQQFDMVVYGGMSVSDEVKTNAYTAYTELRNKIKEIKKNERRYKS